MENKYLNKIIKTFQTEEDTYNYFKKTCVLLDKQVGDVLTELMGQYNKNHELQKEFLKKSGMTNKSEPPGIFLHDSYWTDYFTFANAETCWMIKQRLDSLASTAQYWLNVCREVEQTTKELEEKEPEIVKEESEDKPSLEQFFWQ